MHVIGMAVRTDGLAIQVAASQPDVLLVDSHLPGGSVEEELAKIRQSDRCPKIVLMSVHAELGQDTLAAGADLFIAKDQAPGVLLEALRGWK